MKKMLLALLALSFTAALSGTALASPAVIASVVPSSVSVLISATPLEFTCPAAQVTLLHDQAFTPVVDDTEVHVRAGSVVTLIVVCGERYGVGHFTVTGDSEVTFDSRREGPSSYDHQQGTLPDFRVRQGQ